MRARDWARGSDRIRSAATTMIVIVIVIVNVIVISIVIAWRRAADHDLVIGDKRAASCKSKSK